MNSSFTLWYEKTKESEDIPSVDIHLNLWINNDKQDDSIDIGFMIKNPKLIKELYYIIPQENKNKKIRFLFLKS